MERVLSPQDHLPPFQALIPCAYLPRPSQAVADWDTSVGWDSIHKALFHLICLRLALKRELAALKASYFSWLQDTGPLLLSKTFEREDVLSRPWVPVLNHTEELKAMASTTLATSISSGALCFPHPIHALFLVQGASYLVCWKSPARPEGSYEETGVSLQHPVSSAYPPQQGVHRGWKHLAVGSWLQDPAGWRHHWSGWRWHHWSGWHCQGPGHRCNGRDTRESILTRHLPDHSGTSSLHSFPPNTHLCELLLLSSTKPIPSKNLDPTHLPCRVTAQQAGYCTCRAPRSC